MKLKIISGINLICAFLLIVSAFAINGATSPGNKPDVIYLYMIVGAFVPWVVTLLWRTHILQNSSAS